MRRGTRHTLASTLKTFAPRDTVKQIIFAPFSSLCVCDVLLFHSWEVFSDMAFSLDDGEEKEVLMKGFSWVVERPTYGDHQLCIGGHMAVRMMHEKVVLEGKDGIF